MLNKPLGVPDHLRSETRHPEPEPSPPFYTNGSIWISLVALVVSFLSFRRTGKIAQSNIFDKRFGDDLRALSRKLERELKDLNAFIYPSQKSVPDQKKELVPVVTKIEDLGHQIIGILRELDQTNEVSGDGWQKDFEPLAVEAGAIFEGVQGLSNSQDALFALTVKKARDRWQSAIDLMRKKLEVAKFSMK